MIYFAVPENGRFGIEDYLATEWGSRLSDRILPVGYGELFRRDRLSPGTWVFAGIDQLTPSGLEIATRIFDTLAAAGQSVLNRPAGVLRRFDLLETLRTNGINRYRAVRAASWPVQVRYPVFIREENRHTGSISGLLRDRRAVDDELRWARFRGFRIPDLLVVEFCDATGIDGRYRKYSAIRLGDAILPRYLDVDETWVVKSHSRRPDARWLEEEFLFLTGNPHRKWLETVFALAGIKYGRVDYGIVGGEPQVWEINTNPRMSASRQSRSSTAEHEKLREMRAACRNLFHAAFVEAWKAVDTGESAGGRVIPIEIPAWLLECWGRECGQQARARRPREFRSWLAAHPMFKAIRPAIEPAMRRLVARLG